MRMSKLVQPASQSIPQLSAPTSSHRGIAYLQELQSKAARPASAFGKATQLPISMIPGLEDQWQHSGAMHLRQLPDSPELTPRLPHTPFLDFQDQCPHSAEPFTGATMATLNDVHPATSDEWVQQALAATTTSFDFPGAMLDSLSQDNATNTAPEMQPSNLTADPAWGDFSLTELGEVDAATAPNLLPSELGTDSLPDDPAGMLFDMRIWGVSDFTPEPGNLAAFEDNPRNVMDAWVDSSSCAAVENGAADQPEDLPFYLGAPMSGSPEQLPASRTPALDQGATLPWYQGIPVTAIGKRCTNSLQLEQQSNHADAALPCWAITDGPVFEEGQKTTGKPCTDSLLLQQQSTPADAALPCWATMHDPKEGQIIRADEHADVGSDNSEQILAREPTPCTAASTWDEACMPAGHNLVHSSLLRATQQPWDELPAMLDDQDVIDLSSAHARTASTQPGLGAADFGAAFSLGASSRQISARREATQEHDGVAYLHGGAEGMGHGAVVRSPIISQQDSRLAGLLQSLAQPVSVSQHCAMSQQMPVLQKINTLRGAAARSPRFKALHQRNIQVMFRASDGKYAVA